MSTKQTRETWFSLIHFVVHFTYLLTGTTLYASDQYRKDFLTENIINCTLHHTEEHQDFVNTANTLPYHPYSVEDNLVRSSILVPYLTKILPEELVETLKEVSVTYSPSVIIIRGLPHDSEIPRFEANLITDRGIRADAKLTKVSESIIHALANLMGCYVESTPTEHQGRTIHNIIPISGEEESRSSIGKVNLDFHIDGFYASKAPDFIILFGLEPDFPGDNIAATSYLFINHLLSTFDPEIIEEMKKPQFKYISSNPSIQSAIEETFPLIQQEGARIRFRFFGQDNGMFGMNQAAERVISYVKDKLQQETHIGGVVLQPGDALIINNGWGLSNPEGVMHGRTGYVSNPCRWMQRGYLYRKIIKTDLDKET